MSFIPKRKKSTNGRPKKKKKNCNYCSYSAAWYCSYNSKLKKKKMTKWLTKIALYMNIGKRCMNSGKTL